MIKQQVFINGVPTMVLQSELIRKVIGQDENGDDIYGDCYKYYDSDMNVDWAKENADIIEKARVGIENEIVKGLNEVARQYRYDDIKSARASAGVPLDGTETPEEIAIYNEALSLAKWDRAIWAESSKLEQQVLSGEISIPSSNPEDENYIWTYLPVYIGV